MALPLETEATARRRILNICQDNARNVVEIVRKLFQMTEAIARKQDGRAKEYHKEILGMIEQSNKLKSNLLQQVASLGLFLINREDFLRLTFRLSEITDTIDGVSFRFASTFEKKMSMDAKFTAGVSQLTSLLLEEATKMRETLMSLTFNPSKALELASAVEEIERKIDLTYRMLDMELLTSKTALPTLLVQKDIVERLERIADLIIDTLDQIRVLAISS